MSHRAGAASPLGVVGEQTSSPKKWPAKYLTRASCGRVEGRRSKGIAGTGRQGTRVPDIGEGRCTRPLLTVASGALGGACAREGASGLGRSLGGEFGDDARLLPRRQACEREPRSRTWKRSCVGTARRGEEASRSCRDPGRDAPDHKKSPSGQSRITPRWNVRALTHSGRAERAVCRKSPNCAAVVVRRSRPSDEAHDEVAVNVFEWGDAEKMLGDGGNVCPDVGLAVAVERARSRRRGRRLEARDPVQLLLEARVESKYAEPRRAMSDPSRRGLLPVASSAAAKRAERSRPRARDDEQGHEGE